MTQQQIPRNTTVDAVRQSWQDIEARRSSRKRGGNGQAKPISDDHRQANYTRQNGTPNRMTDRQIHQYWKIVDRRIRRFRHGSEG